MVLSRVRFSQNFCEISQVLQSQFLRGCQRLGVSNFCKEASDYRSQSRILKSKKVSGSQRKTPVLPSREVSLLPFDTPYFGGSRLERKIMVGIFI